MKKFVFSPKLGWSVSRYNLFETCKRQYYYNYYAKYDTEYPTQKILALKKNDLHPPGNRKHRSRRQQNPS